MKEHYCGYRQEEGSLGLPAMRRVKVPRSSKRGSGFDTSKYVPFFFQKISLPQLKGESIYTVTSGDRRLQCYHMYIARGGMVKNHVSTIPVRARVILYALVVSSPQVASIVVSYTSRNFVGSVSPS